MSKEKHFLVIELAAVKRLMSEIFYRIEATVKKKKKKKIVNLFCSPDVIQIDGKRLLLGKITCFKGVIILFDGLSEVICHEQRKLFINAQICIGKVLLPFSFSE